jgi:hypothetical protein
VRSGSAQGLEIFCLRCVRVCAQPQSWTRACTDWHAMSRCQPRRNVSKWHDTMVACSPLARPGYLSLIFLVITLAPSLLGMASIRG